MGNDKLYKLVLLDAARKYFSPAQIKRYIDVMAEAGFNQLQLYLSDNQGFRFALDDMVVETRTSKKYDLKPCLGKGYEQKDKQMYPHDCDQVISQSEMDEIISYAKDKKMEIVPCLNSPGHMGTVLQQFPEFRYTEGELTSKSSIDLRNEEAIEFALGFVKKYVDYFQNRGITFFNIGADEYANDVDGMGFEGLVRQGLYENFVQYINHAAQIVLDAGMIPRVFNDSAYYADLVQEQYQLNKKIQIYYWEKYDRVPSAKLVADQGHKLINANKILYFVVAENPWVCVNEESAKEFELTVFADGEKIENTMGMMMSIWCDDGRDETMTSEEIMEKTFKVIKCLG